MRKNWRIKISNALKGRHLSNETKQKIRAFNLGRHPSVETRKKMSLAKKGVPNPMKGKKRPPEFCKKISIAITKEKNPNWKGGFSLMKGYDSFIQQQREKRKRENGGTHTFEEWLLLKAFYNYMCLCCKRFEPQIKLTEDHIIPISKGGSNDISNIQPLCSLCNSIKRDVQKDYTNGRHLVFLSKSK